MHIFLRATFYFAGLLISGAPAHAMLIRNGCSAQLDKRALARVNGPLGPALLALSNRWRELDVTLEWKTPDDNRFSTDLPTLAPQSLERGNMVASVWAIDQLGNDDAYALKLKIRPFESGHVLIAEDELDVDKDAAHVHLLVSTALSAVPSVKAVQVDVTIKRDDLLDFGTPPDGSLPTAEELRDQEGLERISGSIVHRLNVQRRALFDTILKHKAAGLGDAEIVDRLGVVVLNTLPLGFGPWELNKLRIIVRGEGGRRAVFENGDAIVITYLFVRP